MGRPLRILNTSDLAEMSDAEIKSRIAPLILDKFAQSSASNLITNSNLAALIEIFEDLIRPFALLLYFYLKKLID